MAHQGPYPREYGVATTVDFVLYEIDGIDFKIDAVSATGDVVIMKDEGDEATLAADAFTDEGTGYSLTLTATEMQAARIVVYVVDQGTKVWLDTSLLIETYGNPSSQYGVSADVLVSTDIATLASQTSFTLTAGSADDDAYNGAVAVITDATTNTQKAVGLVSTYTGLTKTVALASDPAIFTMAAGDLIDIIAVPKQLPDANHAAAGGLPTVDANNYTAGIQGTKNVLDDLNDLAGSETILADTIWDYVYETGGAATKAKEFMRLAAGALWGKLSGAATTTVTIRDESDVRNRIVATVDSSGNRTGITVDKN